jgi:hypothetical protein|tara:strand:+ start:61 stop:834 length:774 start_codon:yes stop_codon:yes gene_type:complete
MLEHVIRTPFDMKPVFKPCERPTFNANDTDVFIQSQKRIELDNLGKNIWFETPLAVEEELVFKTAQKLGLFNQKSDYRVLIDCENIQQLGLAIEDDIVIMHNGKLESCFVAFPSSWNAGEKVGKTLAELHEPIADNETLVRASDGIMRAMTSGQSFERYTWGITSLDGYSNHPLYEKPDFDSLDDLTFRVEHERTMTVIKDTTAVFLIHVDIYPLKEVLKTDLGLIKGSIDSMSANVLQYKNLVKVKELMNEYILST